MINSFVSTQIRNVQRFCHMDVVLIIFIIIIIINFVHWVKFIHQWTIHHSSQLFFHCLTGIIIIIIIIIILVIHIVVGASKVTGGLFSHYIMSYTIWFHIFFFKYGMTDITFTVANRSDHLLRALSLWSELGWTRLHFCYSCCGRCFLPTSTCVKDFLVERHNTPKTLCLWITLLDEGSFYWLSSTQQKKKGKSKSKSPTLFDSPRAYEHPLAIFSVYRYYYTYTLEAVL